MSKLPDKPFEGQKIWLRENEASEIGKVMQFNNGFWDVLAVDVTGEEFVRGIMTNG